MLIQFISLTTGKGISVFIATVLQDVTGQLIIQNIRTENLTIVDQRGSIHILTEEEGQKNIWLLIKLMYLHFFFRWNQKFIHNILQFVTPDIFNFQTFYSSLHSQRCYLFLFFLNLTHFINYKIQIEKLTFNKRATIELSIPHSSSLLSLVSGLNLIVLAQPHYFLNPILASI